ncbi:MAG: hypothetical protein JXP73_10665 [Deltaproteobacteria bacterium]|nr:hypothetical protein [Deltaproteobacteria bacterium]
MPKHAVARVCFWSNTILVGLVWLACRTSPQKVPEGESDAGPDVTAKADQVESDAGPDVTERADRVESDPRPDVTDKADQAGAVADVPARADFAASRGIGRPCDLTVSTLPSQAVYNASAGDCPSHLCLKPMVQPGASGTVDTEAVCSAECSQDSDCAGEMRDPANGLDKRCAKGFACGIPFTVGQLCCKKLCVCKDFFGPSGATTPSACRADSSGPGACSSSSQPIGNVTFVEQETDVYVSLQGTRQVDLVTMVDNSPSMAPKVSKMNSQFSKLIAALKDPIDGSLPDLRVAIIDSDLGTAGAYQSGTCGPKTLPDGTQSPFGDLGRFQMLSSPTACTFAPGALFLEHRNGQAANYSGDISSVFSCLISNLGTLGCGMEHQLQAYEFALAARGVGNEAQQQAFLRPSAQLGLVFLSDEDDCSVHMNDGMLGDRPELRSETASLRCATRGHMCSGRNLTDEGDASVPGYPTTNAYTHAFRNCMARTDACPNTTDGYPEGTDTSVPTECSPLKSISHLAGELKSLKSDPDNQIVVAGIFGWPPSAADMETAEYKIGLIPNPNTADTVRLRVFEYWPVCYDPDHPPSHPDADTGFDVDAAGWGATGGLRLSAFVDEFGKNGLKFSICERDFTASLDAIGRAIARKVTNLCFDDKLVDTDGATAGVQADCRVALLVPTPDPKDPTKSVYQESLPALPQCLPGATNGNVATDCWQLLADTAQCPVRGQMVTVLRTAAEISAKPQLDAGTKLQMQCRTCPEPLSGNTVAPGCDY